MYSEFDSNVAVAGILGQTCVGSCLESRSYLTGALKRKLKAITTDEDLLLTWGLACCCYDMMHCKGLSDYLKGCKARPIFCFEITPSITGEKSCYNGHREREEKVLNKSFILDWSTEK